MQNQLGCKQIDTLTIDVEVSTAIKEIDNDVVINCDGTTGCRLQINGNALLEVFDVTGRKIDEEVIITTHQLATANYSPGIYFLKLSNSEGVLTKKFVKN